VSPFQNFEISSLDNKCSLSKNITVSHRSWVLIQTGNGSKLDFDVIEK